MPRASEKEIIEYLRSKGGSATTDEMRADGLGDVGKGWNTMRVLRRMLQKGLVEREIRHTPERQTIIRWSLKKR
ncbi:MAG: hypothetical protein QXH26_05080 [Candidatus Hadarchaeales archaeon]